MCDYAKDFHYISNPTDQCACVPSKEDCSCYYDPRQRLKVSSGKSLESEMETQQ